MAGLSGYVNAGIRWFLYVVIVVVIVAEVWWFDATYFYVCCLEVLLKREKISQNVCWEESVWHMGCYGDYIINIGYQTGVIISD